MERVRHYVGSEGVIDRELRPSPVLAPELDTEWGSDDESFANSQIPVSSAGKGSNELDSNGQKRGTGRCQFSR